MELAVVALAALMIGFGKAGVAGTLGPFVTVLVALVLSPSEALGVLLPMLIFADIFALAAYWRRWDLGFLRRLLAAAVVGIVIGTFAISIVDDTTLRRLIAAAVLVFAVSFFLTKGRRIAPSREGPWGIAAGSVSGLTSTIAHAGGPPIVVYLIAAGVEPVRLVGTTVAFFATVNLVKVPGYLYADLFDAQLLISLAPTWALVPVGIYLGKRLVQHVNTGVFERVTLVFLVSGAVLLLLRG